MTVAKDLAKLTLRSQIELLRGSSTGIPKPFPGPRGFLLEFFEPMRETIVWMERERAGEAAAQQLGLPEPRPLRSRAEDPDVGEQPPVVIARFDPDQQPHPVPFDRL